MQVAENAQLPTASPRVSTALTVPRRSGTIPVTVRLDPPRYDRLERLVARLSTTGQSIIQTALDRSLSSLERTQTAQPAIPGQRSLFTPAAEPDRPRRPRQDSFAFVRPEPTIALTYRASVPMHRWLHRRSHETGQTIQDIIDSALKAARGESQRVAQRAKTTVAKQKPATGRPLGRPPGSRDKPNVVPPKLPGE